MEQQVSTTPSPTNNLPPPTPQTSSKAIVSLILGILSLACCGFFSGIPAIIMGKSELNAIKEGRASEANKSIANIGMILGIIGSSLSLLAIIGYAILLAIGLSMGVMNQ